MGSRSVSGAALLRRRPGAVRATAPAGSKPPKAAGRGVLVAPNWGRGPQGAEGRGAAGPQRRRRQTGLGPGLGTWCRRRAQRPGRQRGGPHAPAVTGAIGGAAAAEVQPDRAPHGHTPPPSPAGPGWGWGRAPRRPPAPFQAQDLGLGRPPRPCAPLGRLPGPRTPERSPEPPTPTLRFLRGQDYSGTGPTPPASPRGQPVRPAEGAGLGKQTGGRGGLEGAGRRCAGWPERGAKPAGEPGRPAVTPGQPPGPLQRAGRPARRAPPGLRASAAPAPALLGPRRPSPRPTRRPEGQPSLTPPPKPKSVAERRLGAGVLYLGSGWLWGAPEPSSAAAQEGQSGVQADGGGRPSSPRLPPGREGPQLRRGREGAAANSCSSYIFHYTIR